MKKLLLFGLIIAAAVVFVRSRNISQDPSAATPTPSTSNDTSGGTYSLIALENTVSVKRVDATEFKTITGTVSVTAGDEIKTSTTGRAKLVYPNGTITGVEEDSHIKIAVLEQSGNKSRLDIIFGGVVSKIKNALGSEEYYEVQTENVVASVRGTVFNAEFRNGTSNVFGIENTVRVRAKDPKLKKVIEGALADVKSGEKTTVSSDKLPAGNKLKAVLMDDTDFQRKALKRHVLRHIDPEDLQNPQVREFVRKMLQRNAADREFIRDMIERRLDQATISATPIVAKTSTPLPITTSPTPTATATVTPTTTPTPTPTATATVTATPAPEPVLGSVFPKTISGGEKFTINGSNFTSGRNTPQVSSVLVGSTPVQFSILDSLTIFVTAPTTPGLFDVSIVSTTGKKSTLFQTLTIQ